MELKPVESSNIAAVGYKDGLIRIQFRDGAVYEQFAQEATYEALLKSSSKGRFVKTVLTQLKRIGPEGVASHFSPSNEEPKSVVTDFHLADTCCTPHFLRASRSGELVTDIWACPKCGCLWRGTMLPESSIRNWEPFEIIEVIPLGR